MSDFDFESCFGALTDHAPFPWQRRLYERMVNGDWPRVCDIPTGLGKTSAVACWLIALARAKPGGVPRRLVYVVNRRTIVDQVTDVAERLWSRLKDDVRLHLLRKTLACRIANRVDENVPIEKINAGDAMTISTLRGEFADNGAWRADPARAAIIVGTPDLIGSDLLFSGYRTGKRSLAHHAGLLGHDALIIHDEAHLSPAMQILFDRIAELQRASKSPQPALVIALSATQRGTTDLSPLTLDNDDRMESAVQQRLDAAKRLALVEPRDPEKWRDIVRDKALRHRDAGRRVIIYVRSPEDAATLAKQLANGGGKGDEKYTGVGAARVELLTGRLRGMERDALVKPGTFRALHSFTLAGDKRPDESVYGDLDGEETVFLVATSAGEVGADFDADHLVCDLTTADALIQRLGRVNRRGQRTGADASQVDVIAVRPEPKKDNNGKVLPLPPHEAACARTLDLLRRLPTGEDGRIDASPRATREQWNIPDDCREPAPETLKLTEPMVSALSMTSVDRTRLVTARHNGRQEKRRVPTWPLLPDVATLIHGLVEETAEVTLAWRAEVPYLADADRSAEDVDRLTRQVLKACPISAAERLTLPTHVAAKWIGERAKKLDGDTRIGLLVGHGGERLQLDGDVEADKLVGRTLMLPPDFGGLDKSGMLDADTETPPGQLDLGDRDNIHRYLLRAAGDGFETRRLAATEDPWLPIELTVHPEAVEHIRQLETSREALKDFTRRVVILLRDADDEKPRLDLVVFRTARGGARRTIDRVRLVEHNEEVRERATRFAKALGLPNQWRQALEDAAQMHDTGKDRFLWQTFAGNHNLTDPIAKPIVRGQPDWRMLDGYRHEYGSLLDAIDAGIENPLTLHLIASHHAWARPRFDKPFDPKLLGDPREAATALAIALRFDALQKEHGPWGLAWLEALLRSADRTVSAGDAADDFDVEEDADA